MSDRALMQQALDALEYRCGTHADERGPGGAITALRAALAQPEPEPVAWINEEQTIGPDYGKKRLSFEPYYSDNPLHYKHTPLYAAPPTRQWVDLTKDEVIAIRKNPRPVDLTAWSDTLAFASAISEALKAKNGGTE